MPVAPRRSRLFTSDSLDPHKLVLARKRRRSPTPSERLAWQLVRNRQLHGLKFRREHRLDGFVLDLYCAALSLWIEIDGGVHDDPDQAPLDALRAAALESIGLRVLRIASASVSREALEALIAPLMAERGR